LWFEVLLYLSLMLDALSVAFGDRTPNAEMTDSMILASTMMAGRPDPADGLLRPARREETQELAALGAGRGPCTVGDFAGPGVGRQRHRATTAASRSCPARSPAAGLYFSFTGDAKGWFNG